MSATYVLRRRMGAGADRDLSRVGYRLESAGVPGMHQHRL